MQLLVTTWVEAQAAAMVNPSIAPPACHCRDSIGTQPRPRARGGVLVRRRRRPSRGLPLADARDRIAVEHLCQDPDPACVRGHEHPQLTGDDLPEEAVSA